jgi:hypothetical protein
MEGKAPAPVFFTSGLGARRSRQSERSARWRASEERVRIEERCESLIEKRWG